MPTDLRHLYAALSADADTADLDTAASVRRRADRYARTAVVAACVGAAVAVGGVALATNVALSGHAPTPGDHPSPIQSPASPAPSQSSSAPPSSSPPSSAPQQIVPPANAPIPDGAFFTPPANRTHTQPAKPTNGRAGMPSLCGAALPSDAQIGRQRGREILFYDVNAAQDAIPLGTIQHTIAVYRPGGAAAAMTDWRAAVAACPSERLDTGATVTYRLATPKDQGDDAILIEAVWHAAPADAGQFPSPVTSLVSIVRVGDVVTILYAVGWEGIDADRSVTLDYTDRAVLAIETWRTTVHQ
jgi:hypothetical protein